MKFAAIKTNAQDWDDIKIAIGGDQPTIIVLKDRTEAETLHHTLLTQLFADETATLNIALGGNEYILESPLWTELLDSVAAWMAEYLPATDPDFATTEIDLKNYGKRDLTAAGTDTSAQIVEFRHYQ